MFYGRDKLEGLLKVKRFTDNIPWQKIRAVKIVDDKKGPLVIETSSGSYFYWNATISEENFEIAEEINKRMKAGALKA